MRLDESHRTTPAKASLTLSADPTFQGDPDLLNPEQLLVIRVAAETDPAEVERLAHLAHEECYIANSLSGSVLVEPSIEVRPARTRTVHLAVELPGS